MKTFYLVISLLLVTSVNSVFANFDGNINSKVRGAFEKEFSEAQNINWTTAGRYVKATFNQHGQEWYAFYAETGERVALGRNIHITSLPINLINDVRNSYRSYWITSAFEIYDNSESAYYVTIENADEKITLKSIGTMQWSSFSTTSKE